MFAGENIFQDDNNVSNIVHPCIRMLKWQNTPNYWGPYYGSTVTIQSVSLELIEKLESNMDKIKNRFPSITEFQAHLTMPSMGAFRTPEFKTHNELIKELQEFTQIQPSIKFKLRNSYFDLIIYVEKVKVEEKLDKEKLKKLELLSPEIIIRCSNLTGMYIGKERKYTCYDLIIKYERSNQ
uniref:2'-5' RNA ligase n=2 Tax=Acrobeloides nanus TaxID=290746 RepID=A0A914EQS1_9BILA